ncbi:MAG: zinc-binding dehydrogenase [Bacteroidales bacterium]|nr:zinc-binding dehydrogenase [Bacteroidales bacterium]
MVFECCGKQEAVNQAIDLLTPGGTLVLVGIPEFNFWNFPTDTIRRKELNIINIRRQNNCAELSVQKLPQKKSMQEKCLPIALLTKNRKKLLTLLKNMKIR